MACMSARKEVRKLLTVSLPSPRNTGLFPYLFQVRFSPLTFRLSNLRFVSPLPELEWVCAAVVVGWALVY